jgi:hypothetical protein
MTDHPNPDGDDALEIDVWSLVAGPHINRLSKGGGWSIEAVDRPVNGRSCGDCQLCCKLLPVVEISKAGGERCRHQKVGKGCQVYQQAWHPPSPSRSAAGFPPSCAAWSCRWLIDPETAGLPRPDRCHWVIDPMTDYIALTDDATGERQEVAVLQVWVDPAFPAAHRDRRLRDYLSMVAEKYQIAGLVRWNASDGVVIIAPSIAPDGKWHELPSNRTESRLATPIGRAADRLERAARKRRGVSH